MKNNDENKKDFQNEPCLHVATPLVKMTLSWMSIEDVGDKSKARELPFEALGNNKLYMTNADKTKPDYVRLYIVGLSCMTVRSLYVNKNAVYPGERYHHVTVT